MPPPEYGFQVSWAKAARDTLLALAQRASEVGLLEDLEQVVSEISERLQHNPADVGELRYTRGNIETYVACQKLLWFEFAVDRARRFVLVRRFRASSGYGLDA